MPKIPPPPPSPPVPPPPLDWMQLRSRLYTGTTTHTEGEDSKYLTYQFSPRRYKTLELMHLTDLQYGHRQFDETRFLEYRRWLLDEPQRFVVLGGDLVDSATRLSVGSPYDNTSEPRTQVTGVCDLLHPLQPRILGYVGGNHERRALPTFGDLGHLIAEKLSIPYSRGKQYIDLHYGSHAPFKVSLWHGGGAARTKGSKAQMLHRFMGEGDSQLYLVGHLHDAMLLWDWRPERHDGKIVFRKLAGIMSSSFLRYWNTYAEEAGLSPSDTMMARVVLAPSGHWEVTLR